MMRFFVRFRVETLASVAERIEQQRPGNRPIWEFSWPSDDSTLVLRDLLRNEEGVLVHEGLGLDLAVPGESMVDAIERAQNLAEGLTNLISYSTSAACTPAALRTCYEVPKGQADVDVSWVRQRTKQLLGDLRPIDPELLSRVYALYDNADEDTKWRISQAAQWLRRASLELETVGEYIAYWVGLEAASSKLLELLLPNRPEAFPICKSCKHNIDDCPECGESLGRPDTSAGIAELFRQRIPDGEKTFKKIRSHRGGLLHGGKKLKPAFLKQLRLEIPVLREALIWAIGVCLGLGESETMSVAKARLRRAVRPVTLKISGRLTEFSAPPLNRPDLQPYVEHEPTEKYSITSKGKLNIAYETTLTMRNASFKPHGYEMWGDEHAKAAS